MVINDFPDFVQKTREEFVKNQYFEVVFPLGLTLEKVYSFLREQFEKVRQYNQDYKGTFGIFNCWVFTSDMSEDDIYMDVHGLTKNEFDERKRQENETREIQRKEKINNASVLVEEFMKESVGADWIKQDLLDEWKNRMTELEKSIYSGLVKYSIEIMKVLAENKDNKEVAIETAKELFENQGHSNFTASIVANNIYRYSKYFGKEFYNEVFKQ